MEYVAKHFSVSCSLVKGQHVMPVVCFVVVVFVCLCYQKREVNTLLEDVIKHMIPDRAFEKHYSNLVSIISRIITHMTDYAILFSMVTDTTLPAVVNSFI